MERNQKRQGKSPLPPLEVVSQVRSWFDRLTTNGPQQYKNQLLRFSSWACRRRPTVNCDMAASFPSLADERFPGGQRRYT